MRDKIFSPVIFDLSMRNLRLNFLRSLLAMIGIIIGVVAITSMGMIDAAFSEELTGSLTGTSNSITVSGISSTGSGPNSYMTAGLSTKDLRNIESAVKSVTENYVLIPMCTGSDTVRPAGSDERMQASIYGLNAAETLRIWLRLRKAKFRPATTAFSSAASLPTTTAFRSAAGLRFPSATAVQSL